MAVMAKLWAYSILWSIADLFETKQKTQLNLGGYNKILKSHGLGQTQTDLMITVKIMILLKCSQALPAVF
jgi:hypothetical protein